MNKKKIMSMALASMLILCSISACSKGEDSNMKPNSSGNDVIINDMSPMERSVAQLSSTDVYDRSFGTVGKENSKQVGLFYFLWQGVHLENQYGIHNITQLLEENPELLFDASQGKDSKSPYMSYHYWGEPLYGYYTSYDEWVMNKHVEMFALAGIDYLVMDATNGVYYEGPSKLLMSILDKYMKQGWKVPKVVFYTNSGSVDTIKKIYNSIYKENIYPNTWYKRPGSDKPFIIGWDTGWKEEDLYIKDFFDMGLSQWPNEIFKPNGFPWMEFSYPQQNHNGTMSVSIAQHLGNCMMSTGDAGGNWGRGFSQKTFSNEKENMRKGTNFEDQWKTVFDNIDSVNNVHITGWNEWIALKAANQGKVFFVDTFNEEFSRDIEPMKGGYGDNFYLQMIRNIRKFKYEKGENILPKKTNINIKINDKKWDEVTTVFKDFTNEIENRDAMSVRDIYSYKDASGRNDIDTISVAHDDENLYIKIKTVDEITIPQEGDSSWMNVLIKCNNNKDKGWNGYHYILNRKTNADSSELEKLNSDFTSSESTQVYQRVGGENFDTMYISIPLSALGMNGNNVSVDIKVADNVQHPEDIMDYYVTGDVAPIGRLNYHYGK